MPLLTLREAIEPSARSRGPMSDEGIRMMISQELKQQLSVDGAVLEYEIVGTGEPVVLIHGALIAEAYAPLCAEPALTAHYRLVRYHRRGYAGSSRVTAPFSIAQQAADCLALLRHLGIERAHVVGHSSGGPWPCSWRSTRLRSSTPWCCSSRRSSTSPAERCSARRSGRSIQRYQAGRQGGSGRRLPARGRLGQTTAPPRPS